MAAAAQSFFQNDSATHILKGQKRWTEWFGDFDGGNSSGATDGFSMGKLNSGCFYCGQLSSHDCIAGAMDTTDPNATSKGALALDGPGAKDRR